LLSDDGVIFVQCDDNEQAYLKVLMDEVFGRDNFISNIIWKGRGGRQDTKHIAQIHEIIICYGKFIDNLELNKNKIDDVSKYPYFDKKEHKNYKTQLVRKWGSNSKREDRPNLFYKVEFKGDTIYPILPNGCDGCWRWSKKRLRKAIDDKLIISQEKNNKVELYEKIYQGDGTKEVVNNSVLDDTFSGEGAKHILNIFKENVFDYTKPEGLLKIIINMSTKKGDLVLDYHLGSGTTCAVAHKMGRQYIGIEQMDYIEDIAVKRMQKVIEGEQGGISKSLDWQGGGKFIYFELDKYNQVYIDNLNAIKRGHASTKTTEQLYDEIVKHAFLNYDVESKKLLENKKDFAKLSLNEQQEFLISILNKNQLYKNLSEMDDKELLVDEKTKTLNTDFYGK
jgi:adenine-specific DNA-methyltransferase